MKTTLGILGLVVTLALGLGSAGAGEPVRLALSHQPGAVLLFVALERGLFREQGLDVSLDAFQSGKLALRDGLLAQGTDFTNCAEVPIALNAFSGDGFRVIASIGTADNLNRLVARRDHGIRQPGDLRGKRIGTQEASAVHYFLHLLGVKYRINPGDYVPVFMAPGALAGALVAGDIDAMVMREPYVMEARRLLGGRGLVFAEPGLYAQSDLIVTSTDLLERRPGVVRAILEALVAAEVFTREHPEEAMAITARVMGMEVATVEAMWLGLDLRVSLDRSLLKTLEDEARWAIRNRLVEGPRVPDLGRLIDPAPLMSVRPQATTLAP